MYICTVEGCERSRYARKWCHAHYTRWLNGRTIEGPIRSKAKTGLDPLIRIFKRLVKDGDCWIWPGATQFGGYGEINIDGKITRVHCYVWTRFNGPIPYNKEICHTCDNRLCAYPPHLWAGTRKENVTDMMIKGRGQGQFQPGHQIGITTRFGYHDK